MAFTLTLSKDCLVSLDQTLNELRKRSQHRSIEAAATDSELMALRSAAVEVAVGAYADGLRKRRRQVPGPSSVTFIPNPMGAKIAGASSPRRPVEPIVCLLPRGLVEDLDEVLRAALYDDARPGRAAQLREARNVVVESAIGSWLILRGYSAVVPPGARVGGLLGVARLLASRRRQRRSE
jgi:hypothetical protein